MKARTKHLAGLGAVLALAAGPGRAADPEPDALQQEAPAEDGASWEVAGRLRASRNTLALEIGGTLVELRISGEQLSGDEPGSGAPGAHDLRATFSVDGKTTTLLLRIVPPAEGETTR